MRKLRRLRAEKGLTMDALEERTGVSKRTISELERGMRAPQALTLAKLAAALGVDIDDLLEDEAPKVPAPPPLELEEQRGGEEEWREKYAEALMEQLEEEGEYLGERIKSSPDGFPINRAHLFGLGLGLAGVLYEEIESTRQPPKALQEAKSRLDKQSELISSLWRQSMHPESREKLDEFKRFATRRAEASLPEVDEKGAHSSPRESESSA